MILNTFYWIKYIEVFIYRLSTSYMPYKNITMLQLLMLTKRHLSYSFWRALKDFEFGREQ